MKPGNILLTKSGVKVLDFGLAKMERAVAVAAETQTATQQGAIMGTLNYMSLEQVQGKDADARSDIFSFGLVLYEMVTGKRAFEGARIPPAWSRRFWNASRRSWKRSGQRGCNRRCGRVWLRIRRSAGNRRRIEGGIGVDSGSSAAG